MNNQTSTRLSGVQKDILFVLYGLTERKNVTGPLPAMQLLELINRGRLNQVADTNFRRSCHTLSQHGLLSKFRDRQSLKLAFGLTSTGSEIAQGIYQKRIEEMG
ncbi:chromosome segregation protein ParM [Lelliottia aquatilis]|uniref:chromosome segregation protein ParM n=1 Tax=Lelliottia aquatilis TaxID=2080838 RepID=UPI00157727BC|nr:chromosome segregation protein ParM [Lelliottia aquatilis]NTZ48353.1 chromosome segregation protein ParM [Lelliottia aquatilis]